MDHLDFNHFPDDALVRLFLLISWGLVPFSASTLWRRVRSGRFPRPIKVSEGITAWRAADIREWLADPNAYRAGAAKEMPASGVQK